MENASSTGTPAAQAHFPLTRDNLRCQLPAVLRQFFECTLLDLPEYRQIVTELYEPDAVFDFPVLRVRGRANLIRFWTSFLIGRALMHADPDTIKMDLIFDPITLRLYLDMEVWIRLKYLAWLVAVLRRRIRPWKVWSSHIIQFKADFAGQLRIQHQEEVANQHIFFGTFALGVSSLRVDEGTPLGLVLQTGRDVAGWLLCMGVAALERLLRRLGVQL